MRKEKEHLTIALCGGKKSGNKNFKNLIYEIY